MIIMCLVLIHFDAKAIRLLLRMRRRTYVRSSDKTLPGLIIILSFSNIREKKRIKIIVAIF